VLIVSQMLVSPSQFPGNLNFFLKIIGGDWFESEGIAVTQTQICHVVQAAASKLRFSLKLTKLAKLVMVIMSRTRNDLSVATRHAFTLCPRLS
jgi:hypothetical protein